MRIRRRRPKSREIRSALAALAVVDASGVLVSEKFHVTRVDDTGSGRTEHVTNAFHGVERWGVAGASLAIVTLVSGYLMFLGRE